MNDMIRIVDERGVDIHPPKFTKRVKTGMRSNRFIRQNGIMILAFAVFAVYSLALGLGVSKATETKVREECETEYNRMLEEYILQVERERSAVMEDADRKEAIEREIRAVAGVISKVGTDQQKLTEASCILARVMNPVYPDNFEEVVNQPQQWMFYDGSDKTYSTHDWELAEKIVRPYMESGVIPNGLSSDMVFGSWSPDDFALRDSFENKGMMKVWRYQG